MVSHTSLQPALFLLIIVLPSCFVAQPLSRTDSCYATGQYFKGNALTRVGPYGLSPNVFFEDTFAEVAFDGDIAADSAAGLGNSAPTAGVDFSDTNVQVEGVDEPDIVKTDGTRVYAVRDLTLFVSDVLEEGAAGKVVGKLDLPLYPYEMLIEKGRVLVFASDYGSLDPTPTPTYGEFPGFSPEVEPLVVEDEVEERPLFNGIGPSPIPVEPFVFEPESSSFGAGMIDPEPSSFDIDDTGPEPSPFGGQFSSGAPFFPTRPTGGSILVLFLIDVSGDKPRLLETLRMDGYSVNSREVGGVARVVLRDNASERLPFVYPNKTLSKAEATKMNKKVILDSSAQDWLPRYHLTSEGCRDTRGSTCVKKGFVSSCSSVYIPTGPFGGYSTISIVTLPIALGIEPQNTALVVSDAQEVYSTAESLYVTSQPYQYDWDLTQDGGDEPFPTALHKFALEMRQASYVASGEVEGSLLNQFSMHEFNDIFFVATTEGSPWFTGFTERDTSKSKVTALMVKGSKLVKTGEVGNLGIGERIFAVRYIASTAYVVTFREVDPLYIIDLSNPKMLRVTGELKIPGFSSYLHPIAPGRILGVGQDVNAAGRSTGAKVTLFDVSDVTSPSELSTWILRGGYSSAEWDHRAFLFWPPESVAVLPISVYTDRGGEGFVGTIVLNVSDDAITERGRISHPKCCQESTEEGDAEFIDGSFSYVPAIERNFILGKVNLWSMSYQRLQINNIQTLKLESDIPLVSSGGGRSIVVD